MQVWTAPVGHLLGDSLRDVDLCAEAGNAQVGRVRVYRGAALAAQDLARHPHHLTLTQRLHPAQQLSTVHRPESEMSLIRESLSATVIMSSFPPPQMLLFCH